VTLNRCEPRAAHADANSSRARGTVEIVGLRAAFGKESLAFAKARGKVRP
jgi:hypothetical protein